jgi:hypothetical protein
VSILKNKDSRLNDDIRQVRDYCERLFTSS